MLLPHHQYAGQNHEKEIAKQFLKMWCGSNIERQQQIKI
jgi:hypothetical protein